MEDSSKKNEEKKDNLIVMNNLTSKDYAAEREKLRNAYKKADKKGRKSIDKVTLMLVMLGVCAVVLTVIFICMLSGIKFDSTEKGSTEELVANNTATTEGLFVTEQITDSTDEKLTEVTTKVKNPAHDADVEEITYMTKHMNDTWYNMDLYRAVCKDVPDEYFENVCFIGDSRTMGLMEYSILPKWHGFYKVGSTANAACLESAYTLDGDYYTNILNIIASIDYDAYYVGYGTNELGYGDSDKFIEELKIVIDCIKDYHPKAIIYVENILPMSKSYSDNNPSFSNSRANEYNQKLLRMCQEYGDVIYLDIASCMRDSDGAAVYDYISDGLHYTPEGYRKIMEFIRGAVVEKRAGNTEAEK
ncbi:MAG: hypothetical protein K6C35_07840 [Eubacterium sp.]|nr:hypothetical protein [Eubacterium sp.]